MASSITELNAQVVYRAGSNAPLTALSRVRGATPALQFTAVSPSGTVSWGDNGAGGTFNLSGAGNSIADYVPANKTQVVLITATDGAGSVNYTVTIFATFPLYPQLGHETEMDVDTKIKKARDGTKYFREDGAIEMGWVMAWDNRLTVDRQEALDFWQYHRKVREFYLVDILGAMQNKVFFNSSIKSIGNGENRWALSAGFTGVYAPIVALTAGTVSYLLDDLGISASASYGLRKLRSNYTGAGVRVRRASDNAEQDIGFIANGSLDWAAAITFKGASTIFVKTWYDQKTGTPANLTQTTFGMQAELDTTLKELKFSGGQAYQVAIDMSAVNKLTFLGVMRSSTNVDFQCPWEYGVLSANNEVSCYLNSAGQLNIYTYADGNQSGSIFGGFTNGQNRVVSVVIDRTLTSSDEVKGRVDGVDALGNIFGNTISNFPNSILWIGARGAATYFFTGGMKEFTMFPSALTTVQVNIGEANLNAYH